MTQTRVKKRNFEQICSYLERTAKKSPNSEQFDVKMTVDEKVYTLRLLPERPNHIFVLQAAELYPTGGEKDLLPVKNGKFISSLLNLYVYVNFR